MMLDVRSDAVAAATGGLLWGHVVPERPTHRCAWRFAEGMPTQRERQGPIGGEKRNVKKEPIIIQLTEPIPSLQLNWNQLCLAEKNNQLPGSLWGQAEEPWGHILMFLSEVGDPMEIINRQISWGKISNFMPIYIHTNVILKPGSMCCSWDTQRLPLKFSVLLASTWFLRLLSHSRGKTPFKRSSRCFQLSVTGLAILKSTPILSTLWLCDGGPIGLLLSLCWAFPGPGVQQ